MQWTEQKVNEYLAEHRRKMGRSGHPPVCDPLAAYEEADEGPESRLAGRISKWAKDQGYPILNLRQSTKARGFIPIGWPDVTLVLPGGRVLFIELKSAKGRLRAEQNHMALKFACLKSGICVVRSFKRFMQIVKSEG